MLVNVLESDVDGRTYFDVLQNWLARRNWLLSGGWRYTENYGSADNLISGLVASALAYAEAGFIEGVL